MGKFNRASLESMELDLPQSLLFLPIRFCLQRAKGSSLPFWFAASGPRSGYLENILRPRRRVCRRLAYPANLPMRHQTNNMITEIKNFFRASLDYSTLFDHSVFGILGLTAFSPCMIRGALSSRLFELRITNGMEMDMDIIHFRKWNCCLAISHARHAIRQKSCNSSQSLTLQTCTA